MKVFLLALSCVLALSTNAQNRNIYPKMTLELGAGYEYANLENFNQDYIYPIGYGKFLNGLHSGWSANLRAPLQIASAVDVALIMNYKQFRMKDEKPFEYTTAQPYTTQTNQMRLIVFEGGLQSTVYLDQIWKSRQESRLNAGVFGSASFAYSKYKTFVFRKGEGYWATFMGEQIHHWNTTFGFAMRYRIEDSYFNSFVLNTGFNYATSGEEFNVDLNGYFVRLLIGMGR